METKGWITIAVFSVLIIIGLVILLPMLGIEFNVAGYSAPGASYYTPRTTGTGTTTGWGGVGLLLIIIVVVVVLGWKNLPTLKNTGWFLTSEGRKVHKEKRRKREIREKEDLEELNNIIIKGEEILTKKLDNYKSDGQWALLSLFKEKPSELFKLNDESYKIKVVRHSKGITDDGILLDKIINTSSKDLMKDWKFGVYTDNVSDDQMEFVFLHSIIRWCYDRIHQGEMPELERSMGLLRLFNRFMGSNGEDCKKLFKSQEVEFPGFKDYIISLLKSYNSPETKRILSACALDAKKDFDINDKAPGQNFRYQTEEISKLIDKYENLEPFKAIQLYTIYGGKKGTKLRNMINYSHTTFLLYLSSKTRINNIVDYLKDQDIDRSFKEAISKGPKQSLKSFKKTFGGILKRRNDLDSDLKLFKKFILQFKVLSDGSYDWWTQRKFEKFSEDIKNVLEQQYGYKEWTGAYETICATCRTKTRIDTPITQKECSCGEQLVLPEGWIPKEYNKRMALLYSTILTPWIYTLATYKLFYVLVLKYMQSLERIKELIKETEFGEDAENA